jgi:hypothetical protein
MSNQTFVAECALVSMNGIPKLVANSEPCSLETIGSTYQCNYQPAKSDISQQSRNTSFEHVHLLALMLDPLCCQ